MCQGWRKFLLKNEPDSLIKYEQEEGIIIHGTVKKFNNRKKTAIAEVRLLYKNREQMFFNTVETNNRGYFNFGYYDMNDSTSIIIMAKGVRIKKGKKQIRYKTPNTDYFIEMDSVIPPKVTFSSNSSENFNKTYFTDYFERSKVIHHEDSVWAYEGGFVQLEEVKLKSVRRIKQEDYDRKKKTLGVLYFEPSNRLDFNDLGYDPVGNVFNVLQGRIPGLTIRGRNVTIRSAVSITQSNKPLYLLNNIPVDYAAIESVAAHNVHFVDVLKGYRAAIYGSRGSNGVIAVYTKDGTERSIKSDPAKRKGIISFIHPGYNHAREFYDPVYKTEKPEHKRPDYRSTLCWKPNIKLDSNGKTKISFYAADIPTTYRVELQGITSDGVPITSEAYINIE